MFQRYAKNFNQSAPTPVDAAGARDRTPGLPGAEIRPWIETLDRSSHKDRVLMLNAIDPRDTANLASFPMEKLLATSIDTVERRLQEPGLDKATLGSCRAIMAAGREKMDMITQNPSNPAAADPLAFASALENASLKALKADPKDSGAGWMMSLAAAVHDNTHRTALRSVFSENNVTDAAQKMDRGWIETRDQLAAFGLLRPDDPRHAIRRADLDISGNPETLGRSRIKLIDPDHQAPVLRQTLATRLEAKAMSLHASGGSPEVVAGAISLSARISDDLVHDRSRVRSGPRRPGQDQR